MAGMKIIRNISNKPKTIIYMIITDEKSEAEPISPRAAQAVTSASSLPAANAEALNSMRIRATRQRMGFFIVAVLLSTAGHPAYLPVCMSNRPIKKLFHF